MIEVQDTLEIQNYTNTEIKSIINSTICKNNINIKDSTLKILSKDMFIDVEELYKISSLTYKEGDTKSTMAKNLLKYIVDRPDKYKLFSKLAQEMLSEGWCEKIDE